MSQLSCAREGWESRKFSTFKCFPQPAILPMLKEFPILPSLEQTTFSPLVVFFVAFSWMKIPHKCNINIQKQREHNLSKFSELIKSQAQIQASTSIHKILQNSQSKQSTIHLHLTLYETTLQKKPSRGVTKYRSLEKGALKIFRKYIRYPVIYLRWSSL